MEFYNQSLGHKASDMNKSVPPHVQGELIHPKIPPHSHHASPGNGPGYKVS